MPDFSQDPDFVQAPRNEQIAYLKSVDRDFAVASSADQNSYIDSIVPPTSRTGGIPRQQGTERVMQPGIGGPPMWVDVPQGEGQQFEQHGQEGYQLGGKIGSTMMTASGGLAGLYAGLPHGATVAEALRVAKVIKDLGLTVASGRYLYNEFFGSK